MRRLALTAALAAVALTGCATHSAARQAEQLALYRAHAGAPVDSFPYTMPLTQWTALGPDQIAVWTAPTRAWLLDLTGCQDIEWAQAIALSNSIGRVTARFDRVTPLGATPNPIPCRIDQIRPLDVKAIREAERAASATH